MQKENGEINPQRAPRKSKPGSDRPAKAAEKENAFGEPLRQVDRTCVWWRGRKMTYFGGCDYLRLSSHPKVLRAAQNAIREEGLNVAASRRTTGNHPLYEELEAATRAFFRTESAILISCGYLTNIAVGQGLRGKFAHALIDERAHSSLRDALKFLDCPHSEYRHRDPGDLRQRIRGRTRIVVLTDGVFALNGARAPLAEYHRAIHDAVGGDGTLWVDDAHGAGILGDNGRGSVEAAGLGSGNVIQTVTFSKAFGAYGGAILCGRSLAAEIIGNSSTLLGNTPLPLPMAAAALAGLKLCQSEPALRPKLWRNVELFWNELAMKPANASAIVAITAERPELLQRRLLQNAIYPPFIRYGAESSQRFFRFAISSQHSPEEIRRLARTLAASRADSKAGELLFTGLDA